MASIITPELWVAKYIKSATNGKTLSIRSRRILTLFLVPIWIAGLVWSVYMTYIGISAYQKVKNIEYSIRETNKFYSRYNSNAGSFTTDPVYLERLESRLSVEQDNKDLIYYLPAFLIIGFILPWIILRLIFWIIDAKEIEQVKKDM